MSKIVFSLEELLSPVAFDNFMAFYKGHEALHVSGSEGRFADLYSWQKLNHDLNFSEFPGNKLNIVENESQHYYGEHPRLHQFGTDGCTFVLNQIQTQDPDVRRFVQCLSAEINTQVSCNCYASFPGKQGFNIHFDTHDVLILQISGTKMWKIFQPTVSFPLTEMQDVQKVSRISKDSPPYLECELSEGDVLYIPRGHWHYALSETPSLHLTMGITNTSLMKFLNELVKEIMWQDEFLRMDVPVTKIDLLGGDHDSTDYLQHIENFKQHMLEYFNTTDFQAKYLEHCMTKNLFWPRPAISFPEQAALNEFLTPEIVFVYPEGNKVVVQYKETENMTTLLTRGKVADFDNAPKGLFEMIFDGRAHICGEDIMDQFADLSWDRVSKTLRALYDLGVLALPDS